MAPDFLPGGRYYHVECSTFGNVWCFFSMYFHIIYAVIIPFKVWQTFFVTVGSINQSVYQF